MFRLSKFSPRYALVALALVAWSIPGHARAQVRRAPDAEPLAIVVNRANPMNDLSLADLRRIYRGQRSRWPNGRRVTLVMRDAGTPERDAILQSLYRLDEDEYHRGFLQSVFTGEASDAPKTLATSAGVLRFVFNVPGAIGYVRASERDSSVKTLRVGGLLPGEPGYRLEVPAP